jgi:hypothetical protein
LPPLRSHVVAFQEDPIVVLLPDTEQVLTRLDRIQALTDELAKARGDFARQQDIAERIQREIASARSAIKPFARQDLP